MPSSPKDADQLLEELVEYAMDRAETRFLLDHWPRSQSTQPVRLEYELQILKIITIGWSLAYFLGHNPGGTNLQDRFWQAVRQLAAEVSAATNLIIGQDIDYFSALKERLDQYVAAMNRQTRQLEPAQVVGPEFAGLCGDRHDILIRTAGGKMFNNTLMRIRQYLATAQWL